MKLALAAKCDNLAKLAGSTPKQKTFQHHAAKFRREAAGSGPASRPVAARPLCWGGSWTAAPIDAIRRDWRAHGFVRRPTAGRFAATGRSQLRASLVLMIQHNREALGVVINRPIAKTIQDLWREVATARATASSRSIWAVPCPAR